MSTPSPPTNIISIPGNNSISVSWTAPTNTGTSAITKYTVTLQPGGKMVVTDGATTTASITGLTNGNAYTVAVSATNASGTSFLSGSVKVLHPMIINLGGITAENNSINLPFILSGIDTVTIDWGDSIIDIWASGETPTHTYSITGNAMISITGFASIFGDTGYSGYTGNDLIVGVSTWGFDFTSLRGAFSGCSNIRYVPTSIPTSLTNTSAMFYNATSFNQDISIWNTSNIRNMSYMFAGASLFNMPLNSWNTAAVTNMNNMFNGASAFNQSLNSWNTAAVTDMNSMFKNAIAFNKLIGTWDTSSVTNMNSMFYGATAFNPIYLKTQLRLVDRDELYIFNVPSPNTQICVINDYLFPQLPIGVGYSISGPNVPTNTYVVSYRFGKSTYGSIYNAIFITLSNPVTLSGPSDIIYYSPPRLSGLPINSWNTSSVTDMSYMFYGATIFNQPLNSWNTAAVTNMNNMFNTASAFNQSLNSWNTAAVTNMNSMFLGAIRYNQPMYSLNIRSVTDMGSMFYSAIAFNQAINTWNVRNVTNINNMFYLASSFNQNLTSWYLNKINEIDVTPLRNIVFNFCRILNSNLPIHFASAGMILKFEGIDSGNNIIILPFILSGSDSITIDWGDSNTDTWTSGQSPTHTYSITGSATITITGTAGAFGDAEFLGKELLTEVTSWGNIEFTSLGYAFYGCNNLVLVPTDIPNTVTNIAGMFEGASSFNQNINMWNTSAVTNMASMFWGATAFNKPLNSWNTSAVIYTAGMFQNATAFNQPLNSWDTSSVVDMEGMFSGSAFNQPLNSWNTSAVIAMSGVFSEATAFNQSLNLWDTSKVQYMGGMFYGASAFNQPLNSWDTSSVTNMQTMFQNATTFNQNISGWNTSAVIYNSNHTDMFDNCPISDSNKPSFSI